MVPEVPDNQKETVMALSKEAKERLAVALAHRKSANEVIAAIEAGANAQAAHLADLAVAP
jgi:hypothetical protein